MVYALTYYSGLGEVVRADTRSRIGPIDIAETYVGKRHDALILEYAGDPRALLRLRCAENLFAVGRHFGGVRVSGARGLARIDAVCRDADLAGPLRAVRDARGEGLGTPSFVLTVNIIGHHNFTEADVREVVLQHLREAGWREDHSGYEVNVRMQIVRDRGYLGLGMLREPLSQRPYKVKTLPGSLDPTVAYCLAYKTEPAPDDVFLDPMCGAGTVPIERALGWGHGKIHAGDVDGAAVAAARANAGAAACDVHLRQWDARDLPLGTGEVDKAAVNLPYGKDVALGAGVLADVLSELARVVRPGGLVSLLTAHRGQVARWVDERSVFRMRETLRLKLYGFDVGLLVLERS